MKTKKFIGYHIIGANSKEDAQNEKGLLLWSTIKPSWFKRMTSRILGIYWIDKTKNMLEREPTEQDKTSDTQLYKVRPPRIKKPQV